MVEKNLIAQILFATGIGVIILGLIGSIVLGNAYANYDDFNFPIFLAGVISSCVSGFMILGLAELINILNENRDYLKKIANANSSGINGTNNSNAKSIASQLPEI